MDVMTLAAKLTLNTSEFNQNLTGSEQKMGKLAARSVTIGNLTSQAVVACGRAVKNFAKDALQTGMGFDAMMSTVQGVAKASDEEYTQLRQKAMQVGATTKFTAEEAGQALYYMAMAGWDTEKMLSGLDGVISLAAASGEDLGSVSDIVTDALTAFGMSADQSSHFANLLATTATNANTNVRQMGEAFKYIAPIAGAFGVSADEIAESLGLIANQGIKSSQAGTGLRRIFLNLATDMNGVTSKISDAFGVEFFDKIGDPAAIQAYRDHIEATKDVIDEDGNVLIPLINEEGEEIAENVARVNQILQERGELEENMFKDNSVRDWNTFIDEMRAIWNATDEEGNAILSAADKAAWAKKIAGQTGSTSWVALMNAPQEEIDNLRAEIAKTDEGLGAAAQVADTMLDNLQGDITIMNSAIDGLKIIVSDAFKNDLRSFVQTLTEQIGILNEAFEQNGVLGLFTNLANWVINGVTDALSNPNEQQIIQFGEAIGTFIGQVAAKLVTSFPSLFSGIITIGESLAGGLITGLFNGLFGENTEASQLVQGLENQLSGIEVNNVRAVGLINFLHDLAEAGDENVTKTEAWQTAVEELEKIMPGVKQELEREGQTLLENIEHVRAMTGEFRKQAIQQAMTNTLASQYELLASKGVERAREEVKVGIAQSEQEAVMSQLLGNTALYARYIKEGIESGEFQDFGGDMSQKVADILQGKYSVGGENFNLADMNAEQLVGVLKDLTTYLDWGDESIWNMMQDYLSPEEIEALKSRYDEAGQAIDQSTDKISGIDTEMQGIKDDISLTEQAVGSVTQDLLGTSEGVSEAGDAVVDSLNGLAGRIDGTSPEGDSDGSHAKGLWSVPYDDYTATLHRGEMVLTSSQARRYRDGSSFDMDSLISGIVGAVQTGMSGATVNSYLNGKSITQDVSKNTIQATKARRFAP